MKRYVIIGGGVAAVGCIEGIRSLDGTGEITVISEEKPICINKAKHDVSGVQWVLPEDLTYDGQEKQVHLEGLPEGVTAVCAGAAATDVGTYTASAILQYDDKNYEQPDPIPELNWSITKGRYQMDDLSWTYMEAFTYDGETKSVRLEGLPEGTVPYYSGADAVDAGTYFATAGLDFDFENYESYLDNSICPFLSKYNNDTSLK